MEYLDDDNYPTEEFLEAVKTYDFKNGLNAWFELIRIGWNYADIDFFQSEPSIDDSDKPITKYFLSTGGWSGNEDTIGAMQDNLMCWMFT